MTDDLTWPEWTQIDLDRYDDETLMRALTHEEAGPKLCMYMLACRAHDATQLRLRRLETGDLSYQAKRDGQWYEVVRVTIEEYFEIRTGEYVD